MATTRHPDPADVARLARARSERPLTLGPFQGWAGQQRPGSLLEQAEDWGLKLDAENGSFTPTPLFGVRVLQRMNFSSPPPPPTTARGWSDVVSSLRRAVGLP